jgi:hypothetical protein
MYMPLLFDILFPFYELRMFNSYVLQAKAVETTNNQKQKQRKNPHMPQPEEHGGMPQLMNVLLIPQRRQPGLALTLMVGGSAVVLRSPLCDSAKANQ